jgi:hypothetical protein
MANIFVYTGGLGDAGVGSPQFIAAVSLLAGAPLMLSATGDLVPNDGTKPIVGFAPIGDVSPGQAFTPIGLDIVNVNTATPYTAGTIYYMQADGSISSTVSAHYAGTAISETTLVRVPETAASVAAANATPPPIDLLIIDEGPAAATNKILTQNSFKAEVDAITSGTINTATGASGTVVYTTKPNGVHFNLSLTAMPANDYTDIISSLPVIASSYLTYSGMFTDLNGRIAGHLLIEPDGNIRVVRNPGVTGGIGAKGFVEYA